MIVFTSECGMIVIDTRFPLPCTTCKRPIAPGERAVWYSVYHAFHHELCWRNKSRYNNDAYTYQLQLAAARFNEYYASHSVEPPTCERCRVGRAELGYKTSRNWTRFVCHFCAEAVRPYDSRRMCFVYDYPVRGTY